MPSRRMCVHWRLFKAKQRSALTKLVSWTIKWLFAITKHAVCGPSGAGKSTLITMLRKEFPDDFGFSVSHTTRGPRPGEKDSVDYYFVEKSAMEKEISEGKFLETAHVHGNIYGTSFEAVNRVSANDKICILDIDIQVRICIKASQPMPWTSGRRH